MGARPAVGAVEVAWHPGLRASLRVPSYHLFRDRYRATLGVQLKTPAGIVRTTKCSPRSPVPPEFSNREQYKFLANDHRQVVMVEHAIGKLALAARRYLASASSFVPSSRPGQESHMGRWKLAVLVPSSPTLMGHGLAVALPHSHP